ncbi:MAG TPA: transposase [Pirellulales bacterium]|nr:transposase [Pirellulales bacterium]
MTTAVCSRKGRSRAKLHLAKPTGVISPRVQAVGPERFGIVAVDCAKARSKWMLCDFYGRVLVPPTIVEHTQPGLRTAVELVRLTAREQGLKEVLVSVERTGNYHRPVQRAFAAAGYETRVVHPFATKQFRQPANPGDKTDDHDLAAIHRATTVGFGLIESPLDESYRRLRLLVRHRRDLVRKCAAIQCQIREHLELTLPGFAALFDERLWKFPLALSVARHMTTPGEVLAHGAGGLRTWLRSADVRFQERSLLKIVAWAEQAAAPDPDAALHQRILIDLDDDRCGKTRQIQALELEIAASLAATPYVLLMAIPGLNVVSAGDLAGEMGPIAHYANANALTGRAGLFPSRHQSDAVDRQGKIVRSGNKRLRSALMLIADNLLSVNSYFKGQRALWTSQRVDPRLQRTRVVKRFSRLAYAMVAGRQIVAHPCCRTPSYVLDKLVTFHLEHAAPAEVLQAALDAAARQVPVGAHAREADGLRQRIAQLRTARVPGLKSMRTLIAEVLAKRLDVHVQSTPEA